MLASGAPVYGHRGGAPGVGRVGFGSRVRPAVRSALVRSRWWPACFDRGDNISRSFRDRPCGRVRFIGPKTLPVPPGVNWYQDLSWYGVARGHLVGGRGEQMQWLSHATGEESDELVRAGTAEVFTDPLKGSGASEHRWVCTTTSRADKSGFLRRSRLLLVLRDRQLHKPCASRAAPRRGRRNAGDRMTSRLGRKPLTISLAVVVSLLLISQALPARRAGGTANSLITVAGLGGWSWTCGAGHAYQVRFVAATNAPTLTVSVSHDGHQSRVFRRDALQKVILPYGHDKFQIWSVAGGTEGARRQANLTITLGPAAGECLIPSASLNLTTITNG